MKNVNIQAGFSAIELLITLIVASMFLFSGYQIYRQVVRDGADANRVAVLSNKVNDKLRFQLKNPALTTCSSTVPTETNVPEPGIGPVTYTYAINCPNASLTTMKLIRVQASYDGGKIVQHAAYTN